MVVIRALDGPFSVCWCVAVGLLVFILGWNWKPLRTANSIWKWNTQDE